jgi:hypothetical protein
VSQEPASPHHKSVGWQGFTFEVPEDWNVGAVSGEWDDGYLRLDDPEQTRLELKWSVPQKAPDLERTVKAYLDQMSGGRRKAAQTEFESEPGARFIGRRRVGKDSIQPFAWSSTEGAAYGVVWHCKQCERVVVAQVKGRREEKGLEELAVETLSGIEDHPRDDRVHWSLYGLETKVPKDFVLTNTVLRTGLTQLAFKREPESLLVSKWGLAEMLLRGKTLDEWGRTELAKEFRRYDPRAEEGTYRGHPYVHVTGESVTTISLLMRLGRHFVKKLHADQLVAHLWHCEPSNRILAVYGYMDVENRGLLEEIREHTICD